MKSIFIMHVYEIVSLICKEGEYRMPIIRYMLRLASKHYINKYFKSCYVNNFDQKEGWIKTEKYQ